MWKAKTANKRTRYPGGEEKIQGFRRGYALKNKEEVKRKGKEKENQHTYLESGKTEGGLASTKSIEAIISSLMSDIKTKLYEEIQKANRAQECPNRS